MKVLSNEECKKPSLSHITCNMRLRSFPTKAMNSFLYTESYFEDIHRVKISS